MLTKYNPARDLPKEIAMTSRKSKTSDHKGVFSLFVYPNKHRVGRAAAVFGLLGAMLTAGCGGDQPRDDDRTKYYTDQSRAVFAPDAAQGSAGVQGGDSAEQSGGARAIGGWSIVLARVSSGGMDRAGEMLRAAQDAARLDGAYIDQRPDGLVIAYGDYLANDEKAQRDLERVRKIEIGGSRPYAGAIIVPPSSEELRGSNPAYDLRTVKRRYGKQAVYTLQIGVYGRADYQAPSAEDLASFRRAAEEAVRDLRANGETAFYYHAPARSMVTVGVFGEKDFDSTTLPPYQSLKLKAAREKFPHNLLNGAGINETVRMESGKVTRLQSSQLVAIPDR